MKTILIPIDFSGNPNSLINYAVGFGQQFKCKLLFFHSALTLIPGSGTQSTYEDAVQKEVKSKSEVLARKVAMSCQRLHVVPAKLHWEYEVKYGGNVVDDILQLTNEKKIDLIIISTHGSSGLKKFFLGSTSSAIIAKAHIPVLAVPLKYKFGLIKQLVYASDLLDPVNELSQVIGIAKRLHTQVGIVNFNYGMSDADDTLLKLVRDAGITYREVKISIGAPLIDHMRLYMKRKSNCILCMFTEHRTKLEKILMFGSMTASIVEGLKFPLLALPKVPAKVSVPK